MVQGDIKNSQCWIFNNKRRFNNGKYKRYSLGHNLLEIYEGYTISYAKIKKPGVDSKKEKKDINEKDLEESTEKKLRPFIPFAYDQDKGLSFVFYPSSGNKGDIIIDGDFSKLFNEIEETGTYKYILNCISWTSQFSKRFREKGDSWIETFELRSFDYDIIMDANWEFREEKSSKDFFIIYLIDATGSMEAKISAAKEQVINIIKELKNNYPDYSFKFGAIFYLDKIDSPLDENTYFQLTNNIESLKNKISTEVEIFTRLGMEISNSLENIAWREGTKLLIFSPF